MKKIFGLLAVVWLLFWVTTAADISDFEYNGLNFSVSSQNGNPQWLAVRPDAQKAYACSAGGSSIYWYDLSDGDDVSTASYQWSFSISSQSSDCRGIAWSSTGASMYYVSESTHTAYQYNCSTAFLPSSCSYASKSLDTTSQTNNPQALSWKFDWSMILLAYQSTVYQYNCWTAWDLSTCTYSSKSFSTSSQEWNITALQISPNWSKVFAGGTASDTIYQYNCSSSTDISTCTYSSESLFIWSEENEQYDAYLEPNGVHFYIVWFQHKTIFQYDAAIPPPPAMTWVLLDFMTWDDYFFTWTILIVADWISFDTGFWILYVTPLSWGQYSPFNNFSWSLAFSWYFSDNTWVQKQFQNFGLQIAKWWIELTPKILLALGAVLLILLVFYFIFRKPNRRR